MLRNPGPPRWLVVGMTSRRTLLRFAAAAPAAALVGACSPRPAGQTAPAKLKDLLLVSTGDGMALVSASDGQRVIGMPAGVGSWDGTVVASRAGGRVEVRDKYGALTYGVATDAALTPRVVSPGGQYVALASGRPDGGTPYRPVGRSSTTIAVVGPSGELERFTVPGCVEPEAFSPTGLGLYVLDYLPPTNPDRYRVRILDLTNGKLFPLYTRDKKVIPPGAEESMRGEGRQAVWAQGRAMLFTLYTHQPDHEHTRDLLNGGARDGKPDVHAFVHSLSLEQGFAYCIDLPAPFGEGPIDAHAIGLTTVDNPYVVDVSTGSVATLNGADLTVQGVSKPLPAGTGPASTVASRETIYVAAADIVNVLDARSLTRRTQWTLASPVRGLALSPGGERLWVGQTDGVVALDASSGRPVASIPFPGLTTLRHAST
jgi:hypothetical protein